MKYNVSWHKVAIKYESFQDNELSTLKEGGSLSDLGPCLQVLDLQANLFEKLPDDIGTLKQLRVSIIIDKEYRGSKNGQIA